MDYERIYKEFISDRRDKEKFFNQEDYTEKHHIIPRCLNGNDDRENIIRLTPEDHFFSHLILAKIHGGIHWITVGIFSGNRKSKTNISYKDYVRKRISYGFIKKHMREAFRKTNMNNKIHMFKNKEGKIIIGTRDKLHSYIGGSRERICAVARGDRKSVKGWYNPNFNKEGIIGMQSKEKASRYDKKVYGFQIIKTGEVFFATKMQVREKFNLGPSLYRLISGHKKTCKGLRLLNG